MTFHSVGNGIIIPTDEVIFFRRGRYTTNQVWYIYLHLGDFLGNWTGKYSIHAYPYAPWCWYLYLQELGDFVRANGQVNIPALGSIWDNILEFVVLGCTFVVIS